MEPTAQLSEIIPSLTDMVDRIDPMQLNNPTPCSDFTVHDVLDHMIVLGSSFAYWFRGEEAPEIKAPPVYGVVPSAQFKNAMRDLLEAVESPGAMERAISAPVGEMQGETFARFVAFDGLVHGWDLASATGQDWDVPADVIASVAEFAHDALTADMRDGDTFEDATAVPDDASQLERLVAFSGRTV